MDPFYSALVCQLCKATHSHKLLNEVIHVYTVYSCIFLKMRAAITVKFIAKLQRIKFAKTYLISIHIFFMFPFPFQQRQD